MSASPGRGGLLAAIRSGFTALHPRHRATAAGQLGLIAKRPPAYARHR
jgi:hypothetical protein